MTTKVSSILASVKELSAEERQELLEALSQLLVTTDDDGVVPDWHMAILKERLAQPDDEANTVSEQEVWDALEESLKRARKA